MVANRVKSEPITFRMTPEERQLMEAAAAFCGQARGAWAAETLIAQARLAIKEKAAQDAAAIPPAPPAATDPKE